MENSKVNISITSFGKTKEFERDGVYVIMFNNDSDDNVNGDFFYTGDTIAPDAQKIALKAILQTVNVAVNDKTITILDGIEIFANMQRTFVDEKNEIIAGWAHLAGKDPDFDMEKFSKEAFERVADRIRERYADESKHEDSGDETNNADFS